MTRAATLLPLLAVSLWAQMTPQQRLDDFRFLAALYAKQYAPYEWKRDSVGFDLLDLDPWLPRARAAKDDLEFYEICAEYVASLQDSHDRFVVPSLFTARLGFTVDIYDGKVLVDSIDRTLLAAATYPFAVGDEMVSLDGTPVEDWIGRNIRLINDANLESRRRFTAALLTARAQQQLPRAHEIGETAEVVIRRAASGALETYSIRWQKSGTPLTVVGPVLDPRATLQSAGRRAEAADPVMQPLRELWNVEVWQPEAVLGFGALDPAFRLPDNFRQRLGRGQFDDFYTGTFDASGLRVGFLRIPRMSSLFSTANAMRALTAEIAFFQQNTDALLVDVTRNPGGTVDFVEGVAQLLIPGSFQTIGFEIRATQSWVLRFQRALALARANRNTERWVIDTLEFLGRMVEEAYRERRGRTGPIPLNETNSLILNGAAGAYTKPLVMLADTLSASGADMLPAIIQDNARGLIVGTRTNGAGGSVSSVAAGPYSEGAARVTESLMVRKAPVVTPDFPTAPYVEGIGVRPDVALDFMTRENLVNNGRPYLDEAIRILAAHARQ